MGHLQEALPEVGAHHTTGMTASSPAELATQAAALAYPVNEMNEQIGYLDGNCVPVGNTSAGAGGASAAQILGLLTLSGAAMGLVVSGPRTALVLAAGTVHVATQDHSPGHLLRLLGQNGATALGIAMRRASTKL